jgi:tetratricopeptide (TPR) repeat protein
MQLSHNQVDAEDVTRFTDEAISLAESGDILSALPIFEKAAKLQPEKPDMHINLGVTQMRLGLLNAAKKSFNTAKNKLGGMPASNLKDNIDALKEHFAQAKRINHDANTLYREWRKDGGDAGDDYYDDDDDDDDGDDDDDSYGTAGSAVKRSADVSTEYDPYSGDDLYDEMPERNSEESERLTGEAIDLAEAGDVATSLPLFEKAVKLDPSNAKHYENLGVTQMRYN